MNLRFRATAIHLTGSAAVAALAWGLVLRGRVTRATGNAGRRYGALRYLDLSDVVIGPALTAVVADPKKDRRKLVRDLSIFLAL